MRRARRLAFFGLALALLYSGCARQPRLVTPEPVKAEGNLALAIPLHLDRRPVGPPNRLPRPELSVTTADSDEAELLAQSAARRAAELGAVVLSHEVRELPGRRELVMRFGPEGGPERFRLIITWPVEAPRGPRLAIIIDDCGGRNPAITGILDLPVTPSVLPYRTYSRAVAQAAHEAGLEVMLHLPCEPLGSENPGPGALYTHMTDAELRRLVAEALENVGPVDGVNNHMGSKLTSDRRCMAAVLAEISDRGLWFVDSVTYHTTVADALAAERGMPHARRDLFLDNDPARRAVVRELKRAVDLARERDGPVVVIGHDRDATLDAIREVLDYAREAGVALVGVSQCLE